jgi:hypothetical protein
MSEATIMNTNTKQGIRARGCRVIAVGAIGAMAWMSQAAAFAVTTPSTPGYGTPDATTTTAAPVKNVFKLTDRLSVRLAGWAPDSKVDATLNSDPIPLGSFRADATGTVTIDVPVPAEATPGEHTVVAVGIDPTGAPRTASQSIVLESETAGILAFTGSNPQTLVGLGGLLIAVGAAGTLAARRRLQPDTGSTGAR